ncbi:hypothetical protein [Engelhardtia mirabilis]|uniref:Uncharacterized protein n=1 Tax=Engelhardtia mirabilis TaxID=2528011 RepID=A0A518BMK0_9BACT|nr:hypothetical protein Pla133_33060 [Planctomycetes bacterium Pla133]QDV02538.1 hypothetical protein Pla86_33050 [Planctomycetes bacterium Pla86]
MSTTTTLASTESRLFRAYWQDGVLDLLAGAALSAIGLGWIAGYPLAGVVVPPVAIATWPILRQRITRPRLGQVRFNARRRFDMSLGMIAVLSLGVLLCGLFVSRSKEGASYEALRSLAPGIPALLVAALGLSAAAALRLARLAAYSAVFVAAALVVATLDAEPGWALLAGGLVMLASGARLLAAFVRGHPRLAAAMDP